MGCSKPLYCKANQNPRRRLCIGAQGESRHLISGCDLIFSRLGLLSTSRCTDPYHRGQRSRPNRTAHGHRHLFPRLVGPASQSTMAGPPHADRVDRIWDCGIKVEQETSYYLSSLSTSPKHFLQTIRGHWQVENALHWVMDVVFSEDDCRIRTQHAAQNMASLRRMALMMLKQDKTLEGGACHQAATRRLGYQLSSQTPSTLICDCPGK